MNDHAEISNSPEVKQENYALKVLRETVKIHNEAIPLEIRERLEHYIKSRAITTKYGDPIMFVEDLLEVLDGNLDGNSPMTGWQITSKMMEEYEVKQALDGEQE